MYVFDTTFGALIVYSDAARCVQRGRNPAALS